MVKRSYRILIAAWFLDRLDLPLLISHGQNTCAYYSYSISFTHVLSL